jgi:hypothetical protein
MRIMAYLVAVAAGILYGLLLVRSARGARLSWYEPILALFGCLALVVITVALLRDSPTDFIVGTICLLIAFGATILWSSLIS